MLKDPKVQWLKRRVFGKNDPNKILKWTCLLLFWWSVLVLLLFAGFGLMQIFIPRDSSSLEGFAAFKNMGPAFFFIYSACHLISMIAIALIYRSKKIGIAIYAVINLILVFLPMVYWLEFPTPSLVFTLICIILFTVHLGSMGKKNDNNASDDEGEETEFIEAEVIN